MNIGEFGEYLRSFGDYLSSSGREKIREAKNFVASADKQKWQGLPDKLNDPVFVRQVRTSRGADTKLKTHVKSLSAVQKAKPVATITGSQGAKYYIKMLSEGNYGCTCRDWRYRGSVNPGYECKHIKAYKKGKTKVSASKAFKDELQKLLKQGPIVNHGFTPSSDSRPQVVTDEGVFNPQYSHQYGLEDPEILIRRTY